MKTRDASDIKTFADARNAIDSGRYTKERMADIMQARGCSLIDIKYELGVDRLGREG